MKTNGRKKITAADVDRYAILDQKYKEIGGKLNELKERFKEFLYPGQQAVGYAFVVGLSEEPIIRGKVDYREELIKVLGESKVMDMEDKAAEETTKGTPRILPPTPNPAATPEGAKIFGKIAEEVRATL